MIFIFDEHAGDERLQIRGETYKYLIKVRRHQAGDQVAFRHPDRSSRLHTYEILSTDGREALLALRESKEAVLAPARRLHIGWCVIDQKSVEKVLPQLNELGVAKITFIQCARSQKNFKPDFKRFERILLSSMQQCGRTEMMTFDTAESAAAFLAVHPEAVAFDFCDRVFGGDMSQVETVLIGPEGGFCEEERALLNASQVFRLDTPMVMRSETAAVAVSSKILL